jgi:hypothetical protein
MTESIIAVRNTNRDRLIYFRAHYKLFILLYGSFKDYKHRIAGISVNNELERIRNKVLCQHLLEGLSNIMNTSVRLPCFRAEI